MGCQVIVGGFPYSVHDFWRGRSEVGHPRSCQDKIDRSHAHTICTYTYVCIYIYGYIHNYIYMVACSVLLAPPWYGSPPPVDVSVFPPCGVWPAVGLGGPNTYIYI